MADYTVYRLYDLTELTHGDMHTLQLALRDRYDRADPGSDTQSETRRLLDLVTSAMTRSNPGGTP